MQWNEFLFLIRHLSAEDQAIVQRAFEMGERAHAGQKRQSGEPFFTHPIAVARILIEMGADRDTIVAALLHDTVEDTPLTLAEIKQTFGPAVATLIDGLTKLEQTDVEGRPTMDHQIETLRKMFTVMQQDVRIMVIKFADRLHNMQTLGFKTLEKQVSTARETIDVYAKIADRFCMRDMRIALESLSLAILEPELFARLDELRKHNEAEAHETAAMMQRSIDAGFPHLRVKIKGKAKTWDKLRGQLRTGTNPQSYRDVTVVLICQTVDDCYTTLGTLHQLWTREALSFEDFINTPVINGYKGLHTTVILEDGTRVRCKMRTADMDEYAHRGITLHCFDSKSLGIFDYLQWTRNVADISKDTQSRSSEFWDSLQSDIMQESILIYEPGGKGTLVPHGASVLDGAYYQLRDRANFLTRVRINGIEVAPNQTLTHAATLEIELGAHPTVKREWLSSVETGLAIALIREGLGKQDRSEKMRIGREILERHLAQNRRMFLAEIQPEKLDALLLGHGLLPMNETSVLIAEGRLPPEEIERAMFPDQASRATNAARAARYVILCDITHAQRQPLLDMLEPYAPERVSMTHDAQSKLLHCRFVVRVTGIQRREIATFFENVLRTPHVIRTTASPYTMSLSTGLLVILWSVDPVFAGLLLNHEELTPVDLHFIRFLTLVVISGAAYAWLRRRQTVPEAPINLTKPSLWISVALLMLVSLFSYLALQHTLPSHYSIPMTAAGLFVTSIVNRKNRLSLLVTWLLAGTGIAYLITNSPDWQWLDILWTLLAVASFSGFSVVSEQYKRTERISARIGQYFFLLSVFCTLFSLPLLPFATLLDIDGPLLLATIAFCVLCTALPYYIYYTLLTHREIDFVLRFSFIIVPITVVAQMFAGMPLRSAITISALLVMLGASLPLLLNFQHHKNTGAAEGA